MFRKDPRHMGVSKTSGTPKSSILIGFSIINHPFWGTPIFGNTIYHLCVFPPNDTEKWVFCLTRKPYMELIQIPFQGGKNSIQVAKLCIILNHGFQSSLTTHTSKQTHHHLEDGSQWMVQWLGSAPFISHQVRPFGSRGLTNHGYQSLANWDDPPSNPCDIQANKSYFCSWFPVFHMFHHPKWSTNSFWKTKGLEDEMRWLQDPCYHGNLRAAPGNNVLLRDDWPPWSLN